MATADYYDVLGVQPDADFESMRSQYRLLVRQNHPDIASDKAAAHERMQLILQAWRVLSDPAERARYDRARHDQSLRPAQENSEVSPPVATRPSGYVNGRASGGVRMSPSGQGEHKKRPDQGKRNGHSPATSRNVKRAAKFKTSNPRARLLTKVFEAAQLYFHEGRAFEAITICNRVLRIDPKNAEAAALLGDIYSARGSKDMAVSMYERALRSQPANPIYQHKLAALQHNGHLGTVPVAAPATKPVTQHTKTASSPRMAGGTGHTTRPRVYRPAGDSPASVSPARANGGRAVMEARRALRKAKRTQRIRGRRGSQPTGIAHLAYLKWALLIMGPVGVVIFFVWMLSTMLQW